MRIRLLSQILAAAVLSLAALATNPAMAQSRFNVPFNFQAAGKVCPAGTYTITHDKTFASVVLKGDNGTLIALAYPSGNAKDNSTIALNFDRIGTLYYLRTMRIGQQVTTRLDSRIKGTIPGPELSLLGR